MTIRNRPDYGVFNVLLTNAGTMDIPVLGTRIILSSALEGAALVNGNTLQGGTPTTAEVNVQIGKALGDPIPFSVGTRVNVSNKFDFIRLTWAAQAGVWATVVISDDADGNGVYVTAAPTVAAGAVSIVEGGNTAKVNADGSLLVGGSPGGEIFTDTDHILATRSYGGAIGNSYLVTNPPLNSVPLTTAGIAVQPGKLGSSFYAGVPGVGATTIVAAGSNTNGLVVRNAILLVAGGFSNYYGAITAGTSAPTAVTTNPPVLLGSASNLGPITDIFIPAGQGLYMYMTSGTETLAALTYDIL